MRSAPLRLEQSVITELQITSLEFKPREDVTYAEFEGAFHHEIKVERSAEPTKHWKVLLSLETHKAKQPFLPYAIKASILGFFGTNPNFPESEVENLVRITGTSILYSTLREYIILVTSRFGCGPMMLPTVSFTDLRLSNPEDQPALMSPREERPTDTIHNKRVKAAPKQNKVNKRKVLS